MKLNRFNSFKINKDTYFLNVVNNKIITNNKYNGLLIFDQSLQLKKELNIFEELLIYSSFKNDNELLLYCEENDCLVYVNLATYNHKIISLKKELFNNVTFSRLYLWKKNEIFLTVHNQYLYKVSIDNGTIRKITVDQIQPIDPLFIKIWQDFQARPIIYYNQKESIIIVKDYDTQKIAIYDYQNNKEKIIHYPLQDTHDFIYQYGNLLLVHENQIELITANQKKYIEKTKNLWIFLRSYFLSESSFVALLSDQENPEKHELRIYEF